jgi:hypothetical protein
VTVQMCKQPYERKWPGEDGIADLIPCTYIEGHAKAEVPGSERHSWETLRVQDEYDREAAKTDYTPVAIQNVIDGLLEGELDVYLEAILAAGHARKRMRRGGRERTTVEVPR